MNFKVGIIGATGMVGQRFITLLENHPWFQQHSFEPKFYEILRRNDPDIPAEITVSYYRQGRYRQITE